MPGSSGTPRRSLPHLSEPRKVVPGNVMPVFDIADAQKRAGTTAYLSVLKLQNEC
jgi:cytochrome c2